MVIRKRKTNTKRHTLSYLVGNQWVSRKEAVSLAKKGRVDGVTVVSSNGQESLRSLPGYTRLYDLPISVER